MSASVCTHIGGDAKVVIAVHMAFNITVTTYRKSGSVELTGEVLQ